MKERSKLAVLLAGSLLGAGCMAQGWTNADALASESVEVSLDESGQPTEIEFHVLPDAVPAGVRAAMDALHPGGRAVEAEKEFEDNVLYWELTKEIDGRQIEAMFTPEGVLHSEEIEVGAEDVPAAVRTTATARLGGTIAKLEEIHDATRALVEYHVKVDAERRRYKVRIATDGTLIQILREVPAEVEVPLP